jgi:mannosyl-3-phosphoglycerate phosphatase
MRVCQGILFLRFSPSYFLGIFLERNASVTRSRYAFTAGYIADFSDLDGSLLDIHTYEWQPAMPWLDRLQDNQVPVILCSSKTAAEMLDIQQDLGLEGLPFIAENGAVIQPDVRWDKIQRQIRGMTHRDIRPRIEQIRLQTGFKFTTFDDVDEHVISEWTGLTRYRSALARKHEASVTLIWRDTDEKMVQFEEELANAA